MRFGVLVCGATAVLGLLACAEDRTQSPAAATSSPRSTEVRSAGGYRIVGTPLAGVSSGRTPQGERFVDASVLVRLNRGLRTDGGLVEASIFLNGATGASPPVGAGRCARHCYSQEPDLPRSSQLRTGDTATLTIRIPGVRQALKTRVLFRSKRDGGRLYDKLNCGPGTYDGSD